MEETILQPEVAVVDRTKFFEFEKFKVQDITFDQLQRTHKEVDVYGNPLRGMFHFAFIQQILDACEQFGFETEVYDLFAAHNKDRQNPGVVLLPQVEEKYGEHAVEAHILRRVFCNVRIKDFDTEEHTTNLSIAFHQRGIQVGFGPNVKICHNQCMLNPQLYAATYSENGRGGSKYTVQQLIDVVKSWLSDARHLVEDDIHRIEKMKSIDVPADQMFRVIGIMTAMRVASDTKIKEIRRAETYPLNQAQIGAFTEDMMVRMKRYNRISVWDLYDGATNLYKATSMDIPQILPQNRAMVKFLESQFAI